jgi:hypothetical protein
MYPKIWKDKYHGGWWFRYWRPNDREWTEDGPFETYDEAEAQLYRELEELGIEMEGVL